MVHENRSCETTRPLVLITGASGLIGTRVAETLRDTHTIVGIDLKPPKESRTEFVEADLTSDQSLTTALERIRKRHGPHVESVIHLAAYYDFSGADSPLYQTLTVDGTRRLLRELQRQQFDVEQFIFSSTLLVMRPEQEGRHISELSPTEGDWPYPRSKLQAEQVIREERGDIRTVILRIAGVYDERCHSLPLSQQIARIYEKQFESYVFPGNAATGQALVHLEDLANCFRLCIEHKGRLDPEDVFLIAEPEVMSYGELQDRLGELIHGRQWPTIRIPKSLAKAGAWVEGKLAHDNQQPFIKPWMIDKADDHYAVTIAHAKAKLNWEPHHRLRETLPAMIEFLKSDPIGFYTENKLPLPEFLKESSHAMTDA